VPEIPSPLLRSPDLRARAAVVERFYDLRRQTITRRWEAGEISLEHRAALCVDVEYARLTRLQKLTVHATTGAETTTTTDEEQEETTMAMAGDRLCGAVTRLTDRGFGFITVSSARRSIFFHASEVKTEGGFDALALHQPVSFTLEQDATGRPRAVDVRTVRAGADEEDGDDNDGENSDNWEASA